QERHQSDPSISFAQVTITSEKNYAWPLCNLERHSHNHEIRGCVGFETNKDQHKYRQQRSRGCAKYVKNKHSDGYRRGVGDVGIIWRRFQVGGEFVLDLSGRHLDLRRRRRYTFDKFLCWLRPASWRQLNVRSLLLRRRRLRVFQTN